LAKQTPYQRLRLRSLWCHGQVIYPNRRWNPERECYVLIPGPGDRDNYLSILGIFEALSEKPFLTFLWVNLFKLCCTNHPYCAFVHNIDFSILIFIIVIMTYGTTLTKLPPSLQVGIMAK